MSCDITLCVNNVMRYYSVIRQKDQYEVKWFIPLVELSLEDRLESPGMLTILSIQYIIASGALWLNVL